MITSVTEQTGILFMKTSLGKYPESVKGLNQLPLEVNVDDFFLIQLLR